MKALLSILTGLMISTVAHAGFMAEPYIGYGTGTTKCTAAAGTDCGAKSTGSGYGARLGWMLADGLWFAGEYAGGSATLKYDDGVSADETVTQANIGAAAGFDFASGLRLFGGYGFSNTVTDKTTSGDLTLKGTSVYVGLGYKFHDHISVNFQYHMDTFTKFDFPPLTDQDIATMFSKFTPTRMMLSISYVYGSGK